ncbi:MAG: hypothetical protein AAB839_01585 [Patescibacteria group bacterium]
MLNTKDIALLQGMFQEQEKRSDQKLDQKLEDLKINLRDEIHSTVKASEAGLIRRMDAMEERLHKDLEEFIDDNYSPRMYEAEQQILKISSHLKLA